MSKFSLSKSKLAAFEQCPKRLWLSVHKPEEAVLSDAAKTVLAAGNQVGALACNLVPDGILIDAERGLEKSLSDTQEALASSERRPIFEATLKHANVLVRVDLMEPAEDGGWHVAEVKSTNEVKDYQISDLATQLWVLRECGVPVRSAAVRHLNKSFRLKRCGEYEGIFRDHELTGALEAKIAEKPDIAGQAGATLEGPEPARARGDHCFEPFDCPFDSYCRKQQPDPEWPVSLLPRSKKLTRHWADQGVTELPGVPATTLKSKLHRRIHEITTTGLTFHDPEAARAATKDWAYPRTWLDFETIQFAVPRWVGSKPYQQVPFQFSAHVEHEDGQIEHREFLSLDGSDPRPGCAEALATLLPTTGSVIAYNAGFERTCLRELAENISQHTTALLCIESRLVDLLPVARSCWYHREQRGSWSIKAVLPTLGANCSYNDLEICDGLSAGRHYLEAQAAETTDVRRVQIDRALRAYCGRDTLAMLRTYECLIAR